MKITKLEIHTSHFEETTLFYRETLGFPLLATSATEASFQCGETALTIKRSTSDYYYHFAFNIPPNLFLKAKEWTKKRVVLLRERGQDDVHFTDDMAKAIYFEDPAGNIVEFIAREETTPNASEEKFTIGHISGISEIGLSSNQLKEDANQLLSMGIPVRNDEVIHYSSYLTFFGEYTDGVYIILAPVGRRWLFSTKEAIACPILIETDRGTITRKE